MRCLLHWVFLAIAARRMGGLRPAGWGCRYWSPVGSDAALILLHGFSDEASAPAAQHG